MFKRVLKILGIVFGSILLGLSIVYLMVGVYYRNRFMPGTIINGYYADAMSVASFNDFLLNQEEEYILRLYLSADTTAVLEGEKIGYEPSYSKSLSDILHSQNSFSWLFSMLTPVSYTAGINAEYDEDALLQACEKLDCFQIGEKNQKADIRVLKMLDHFALSYKLEPVLDLETLFPKICDCVATGDTECDLSGDYIEPTPTEQQEKELALWEQIDKLQNTSIVYQDGDIKHTLDCYDFCDWIETDSRKHPKLDENGKVQINEDKVREYVASLSTIFNTDQCNRRWKKYKGGVALLSCKLPGYIVDEDAECEMLLKELSDGVSLERAPIYSQEGNGRGNEEVGDTFVEVDLGNQKLYYFEKGDLKLQTDVVTGCTKNHNDTPEMITDIYFMQEGRTLRGENYATFVYYWMAFYNHYGLHDATWRSEFGGDIFKTNGSHGCVNMPKDKAGELYEMVDVGTPVVLYY